jgi:hypothetical protein
VTFSLDYGTILQTLLKMRYSGTVKAAVPSGAFAGGTVFLQFQGGTVQARVVVMGDGRPVSNSTLLDEQLAQLGLLDWNVTMFSLPASSDGQLPLQPPVSPESVAPLPMQERTSFSELSPSSQTIRPRRLPANPEWIRTWPVMHRHVYNLSTGEYSEQDIARLLRYPFADLLNILKDLERMEVIQRGR